MENLVKSIQSFNKAEIIVFLNTIFDDKPGYDEYLFRFIKALSQENYEPVFDKLSAYLNKKWLTEQLENTLDTDPIHKEEAIQKLTEVLIIIPEKIKEMEENTKLAKEKTKEYREIMKAGWKLAVKTDQMSGIEIPPIQKEILIGQETINLPEFDRSIIKKEHIFDCLNDRISRRKFTEDQLSLKELSFLLWATQGVKEKLFDGKMTKRTSPSGGSRHPFETYLVINHVESLKTGIYRYQPLEHQLVYLFDLDDRMKKVGEAALGQSFVGEAALTFIWTVIPYRCEWRYMLESKKIILQDSGHLCQNLYLACEALNLGTCAIGAYDQKLFDDLLKLDTEEEFTIYVAPVGKL